MDAAASFSNENIARVKFQHMHGDQLQVVEHNVDLDMPIGHVKRMIFAEDVGAGKNVRFIFRGHLLEDRTTPRSAGMGTDCVVHVAITDRAVASEQQSGEHVHVGEAHPHRGLDLLIESGFTREEIEFFRQQLLSRIRNTGPNTAREMRQLEENWIGDHVDFRTLDHPPEVAHATSSEGSNGDLFWGILMGFMLGLIAVIFLNEEWLPRRQKIGIFAGLGFNITFGLLHMILQG